MNRRDFIYLKQLGWRLLLALLLFSLARIVFYTLNITHFPPVSITTLSAMLLTGIRFDVAALMYINSLLIVSYLMPLPQRANSGYRRFQAILFFVTNLPVLFLELTDSYYFRFAFRRMISSDLTLLLNSKHLIPNFLRDYWFIGFGVIALIAVTVYLYKKTSISVVRIPFSWQQTLLCCIGIALMILGARGGFQLRPIMNITAVQYVPDTRLAPVVANTTLSLLFSLQQRQLKELHYFRDAQLDLQYDICHRPQPTQPFRPLNVVVIALESFGNEYVGFFNPKSKNTPFFDSLLAMGLCSKNSYANGLRSTQGIVAITLGVPSLMDDPLMFSAYQSNSIHGLAFYLQQKGYSTTFYHGANEGSMEFERFALASGFQQYYDRRHYPVATDYDGNWGIWDDKFFQYVATKTDSFAQKQQPFFSFLFSLTSHHPYHVEEWFAKQYPTMPPLERSVRYTDYALQQFFDTVKNKSWFSNTLFVICADHIGQSFDATFQTKPGRYAIPILFYMPSEIQPNVSEKLLQQIDILPTVLDYLHYDKPYTSFGKSFLSDTKFPVVNYESGEYTVISDSFSITSNKENITSIWKKHNEKWRVTQNNTVGVDSMYHQSKLILQRYHKAMIENKLTGCE